MPIDFKHKPGLVVYLTAGDPDLATTREMAIAAIDNGADVIELGVPFSDPLADGPVIQRASERGADGVLLTDMIVEEADEYLLCMHENDLAPVFLAAPTSPDARLQAIAEHSKGFIYAISRVGITGTQTTLADDAKTLVDRLRQFTDLPIALGFGISTAEHVRTVSEFADAAVVGSAIVSLVEKTPASDAPKAVGDFVRSLCGGRDRWSEKQVLRSTQENNKLAQDNKGPENVAKEPESVAGIGAVVEAGSVAGEEPVGAKA